MYGLCRVRSTVIEGLDELMNIDSESQSGRAGAVTKQELQRTYDVVQMSIRVHITYNLKKLGIMGTSPKTVTHPLASLYSLWQHCA